MKRIIAVFILVLMAFTAGAESRSEPQIAYRILSDFVFQEESSANDRAWTGVMLGIGGGLMAGSAATWFLGDAVAEAVAPGNSVWNADLKTISTVAVGGVGVAMAGAGLIGVLMPPVDVRKKYNLVYGEKDPVVQEALAVAALKELAQSAKDKRVSSAVYGIVTPIATLAVQTAFNLAMGKEWNHDYSGVVTWQVPSIVSSITSLFTLSDEEKLYEKYNAARAAIYAVP